MTRRDTPPLSWQRLQRRAWLVGLVAAGFCVIGALFNPTQFFRSYLMASMFWLGIVLGCMSILMLHHLVGGRWGMVIRRVLEASTRVLPLMLVLCLPLLFGLPTLYAWAAPQGLEGHGAAPMRHLYLQMPFWLGRAAFYFAVWLLLVWGLNRWSRQQEQTSDPGLVAARSRRLGLLSSGGLLAHGFVVTFAAVDWMMSLEAPWYSTIYGFLVASGHLVAAMAFALLALAWLAQQDETVAAVVSPQIWQDLGNLLMAFVLLWAYMSFSQLLIIWSGDLPEEIHWYLHRSHGGWNWIGTLLVVFHFAVPFLLLLSRGIKRQARRLTAVAAVVFVMHLVDTFWLVMPAFFPEQLHVHWLDLLAPISLGGVWLAVWLWNIQRRSLLPSHEPSLYQEVTEHG